MTTGEVDAPDGRFTAVTAGLEHSCGLRTNGTIECWGGGTSDGGPADAPGGRFTAVTAGSFHSCGLLSDGTITCWGYESTDVPD
ncbi:MAG: RCC1 domain-containing protein [bacterium]|nr:RCC1 domain-containing protein [bacterium]